MDKPKLIKKDLNHNIFEYDGGDLWVRENVSYWDDQDHCWDNEILKYTPKNENFITSKLTGVEIPIQKFTHSS